MLRPHKIPQKLVAFDSNAITVTMSGVVVIVLITCLMVPQPHHGYGPHVPRVYHPVAMRRADSPGALRIAITRDGQFYSGSNSTDEIQMAQAFKTRLDHGAEASIYIEADARARYSSVSKVLDAAAAAGIHQIGFLVEQRKDILR